jgi:C-terminal processing protease CtpA/Prc
VIYRRFLPPLSRLRVSLPTAALVLLFAVGAARPAGAQSLSSFDRDRGRQMLGILKDDIKKNYYDPTFRGIDLNTHFAKYDEKIKQATSLGQVMGIIAQALLDFDDSHLFFIPPERSAQYDYGWRMQMIGDKCFVTSVKPGSDAEAKGLKAGDEIYSIDGFEPTRESMWKIQYYYYALRPQPGMRLIVTKPGGEHHQYDVLAKIKEGKRVKDLTFAGAGADVTDMIREAEDAARESRDRYVEAGEELFIWKMQSFGIEDSQVDSMISKARNHKTLVLDLRGNGGGYETAMLRLIGHFFDRDVKVGDIKRRKEAKPLIAKTRGDKMFAGKLVVLVDSESGSAAELFARVVQLEKRGVVVGDRSAGAVMRSRGYQHTSGVDIVAFYGASVTDADIVMTDGKSIEHVGVQPDHLQLLTGADMAAQRDPVLAFATSLAGVKIEPEKAWAFFPPTWKK